MVGFDATFGTLHGHGGFLHGETFPFAQNEGLALAWWELAEGGLDGDAGLLSCEQAFRVGRGVSDLVVGGFGVFFLAALPPGQKQPQQLFHFFAPLPVDETAVEDGVEQGRPLGGGLVAVFFKQF